MYYEVVQNSSRAGVKFHKRSPNLELYDNALSRLHLHQHFAKIQLEVNVIIFHAIFGCFEKANFVGSRKSNLNPADWKR